MLSDYWLVMKTKSTITDNKIQGNTLGRSQCLAERSSLYVALWNKVEERGWRGEVFPDFLEQTEAQ
jgi:hypothetical protein